jgi:hypothetical protein
MWQPYDGGATIGQPGSESGTIVRDEEHQAGARITLERQCCHSPWAVTCGIYGWFFHTRFLGSEEEAEYRAMREGLTLIVEQIVASDLEGNSEAITVAIETFVARFP